MIIKAKTITPLFIGNGENIKHNEHYFTQNELILLDYDLLCEEISKKENALSIAKKINELIRKSRNDSNTRITKSFKEILQEVIPSLDLKKFEIKKIISKTTAGQNQILNFINQNNKYYVPGSSIKGSIRTSMICNYYLKKNNLIKNLNNLDLFLRESTNMMRGLQISDSKIIGDDNFEFNKIIRYNIKNNKKMPNYLILMKAGTNFEFQLKTNKQILGYDEKELLSIVKEHSKILINYELENPYNKNKEFYKKLLRLINEDNTLINIGGHSGFIIKTIYAIAWNNKINFNELKRELLKYLKKRIQRRIKKSLINSKKYFDFPRTKETLNNEQLGWVLLQHG